MLLFFSKCFVKRFVLAAVSLSYVILGLSTIFFTLFQLMAFSLLTC